MGPQAAPRPLRAFRGRRQWAPRPLAPSTHFACPPLPLPLQHQQLEEEQHQRDPQQPATAAGAGLTLQLPPPPGSAEAAAAANDDRPLRWSLDGSSVHSDSWEMLSTGQHSHCGSSPRSVTPSDAYDSEREEEGEAAEAAADAAAPPAGEEEEGGSSDAATAAQLAPVLLEEPQQEPQQQEEEGQQAQQERFSEGSAAATPTAAGAGAATPGSGGSSPRSSFGQASSHPSHHDLYSLSQVGAGGCWWVISARQHCMSCCRSSCLPAVACVMGAQVCTASKCAPRCCLADKRI